MTTAAVAMLHSFFPPKWLSLHTTSLGSHYHFIVENVTEIHLGNHVKHEIISGCDKKDLF